MNWAGYVACLEEVRSVYEIFLGKPQLQRPLSIHLDRWEDNIKMDTKEIACENVDWIQLIVVWIQWLVLVDTVTNPPVSHELLGMFRPTLEYQVFNKGISERIRIRINA
jgi:hypothetical protein